MFSPNELISKKNSSSCSRINSKSSSGQLWVICCSASSSTNSKVPDKSSSQITCQKAKYSLNLLNSDSLDYYFYAKIAKGAEGKWLVVPHNQKRRVKLQLLLL